MPEIDDEVKTMYIAQRFGEELLDATHHLEASRQLQVRVGVSDLPGLPRGASCEIRLVSHDQLAFLETVLVESSRGWVARRVLRVTEWGAYLEAGDGEPELHSDRIYRVQQAWNRGARLTLRSSRKLRDSVAWLRSYISELAA